jgi:SAM-dependent methyltransferase
MSRYEVTDWVRQDAAARTPAWKRHLYRVLRPALDLEGRRHLSPAALARWRPDFVFTRRGLPLEARRALAVERLDLARTTLLVQGTGSGWDLLSWAELRPARILATDAYAFASWEPIARHCRDRFGVRVDFHEAPLEALPFIASRSIDLAASDAVFEHVRDLPGVLAETARVLKPRGAVYASVGPLWYTAGGDHFSARGPLADVFAHIDRDPEDFRRFFDANRHPVEDFQSGGRYVELDLFSKLTLDAYLGAFRDVKLDTEHLALQVSHLALDFVRRYPDRVPAILARHPHLSADDLRVAGFVVRLRQSEAAP